MAMKTKPAERNTTAIDSSAIGISCPERLEFDVESGNRPSACPTAGKGSSSALPPPPSSSFPGISGVNERRVALVGAAKDEERSEEEMMSYLNRSSKLFSRDVHDEECSRSFAIWYDKEMVSIALKQHIS